MGYRLVQDESVQEGIRRIAAEQINKAIDELDDEALGDHDTVHQVRKRCKKLRGLVRLVRPELGDTYDLENAWYRDAARELSFVRDAQSIVDCFDDLLGYFQTPIDREAFAPVRKFLTDRRATVARDRVGLQERLEAFRDKMTRGLERTASWRIEAEGFDAIRGGFLKTYGRARRTMNAAYEEPGTERFHEWRKRAKYHWYHLRLVGGAWEAVLGQVTAEADRLSDLLGDDHDLSNLRNVLLNNSEEIGDPVTVEAAIGLIGRKQVEIRTRAKPLGQRLLAEKPKQFGRRMSRYWESWKADQPAAPAVAFRPDLVTA